jgi:predicted O-methyltransferase YrrM
MSWRGLRGWPLLAILVVACGAPVPAGDGAGPAPARHPGAGSGPLEPAVAAVLADIRGRDREQLAVSEEDGRFLRTLAAASGARRALEIGAASGYSAIWLGLAMRETSGRLVTIEYDAARAREAAANIRRAGLADVVEVVAGDAFQQIPRLAGTFDFVFLDAWKRDYRRFFDLVFPRLERGGLFVAHNVVNKADEMRDFLAVVDSHPDLWTAIVRPSGEGMSVSYRVR